MSDINSIWRLRSDQATHYTTSLAQNALDLETIGNLPSPTVMITRVTIWSDENLDWDIMLFRSAASQPSADPDDDSMVDWISFAVADAVRIAGAGLFRYSVSGLRLLYNPVDSKAHVGLINRNSASKTASPGGDLVVELHGYLV